MARGQTESDPLRLYSRADTAKLARDPNGFIFNPRWLGKNATWPNIEKVCGFRAATQRLERRALYVTRGDGCLSSDERNIVTLNEAPNSLILGVACATGSKTGTLRGHVNWFPVTVTGMVRWNAFSGEAPADGDVNFDLWSRAPSAVTEGNGKNGDFGERGYHLEFFVEETLSRLPGDGVSFWHALAARLKDKMAARELVNDRLAIVTGIFGLDGVHGFHAELHPVLAMSVLLNRSMVGDSVREEWAIMVRNQGNEGDCAHGTLPLITSPTTETQQNFVIDLGWWQNADTARVSLGASWSTSAAFRPQPKIGALVTGGPRHIYLNFRHPRPVPADSDFVFLGTVYVDWPRNEGSKWESRFDPWMPASHPPLKLQEVPASPRSPLAAAVKLQRLAAGELQAWNATWSRVDSVLALRTAPWPHAERVESHCTTKPADNIRLCYHGTRFVLGASEGDPFLGLYSFPHAKYRSGEGLPIDILNYLGTLGYRLEVRDEDFRMVAGGGELGGTSARLSALVSPSTFSLGSKISALSPYTFAGGGVSWLSGAPKHRDWTWNWGIGLHVEAWQHDLFVDAQNTVRHGGFEAQWRYSVGWILPDLFRRRRH